MTPTTITSLQVASTMFTASTAALKERLQAARDEQANELAGELDMDEHVILAASITQIDLALNELDNLNIDTYIDAATGV